MSSHLVLPIFLLALVVFLGSFQRLEPYCWTSIQRLGSCYPGHITLLPVPCLDVGALLTLIAEQSSPPLIPVFCYFSLTLTLLTETKPWRPIAYKYFLPFWAQVLISQPEIFQSVLCIFVPDLSLLPSSLSSNFYCFLGCRHNIQLIGGGQELQAEK